MLCTSRSWKSTLNEGVQHNQDGQDYIRLTLREESGNDGNDRKYDGGNVQHAHITRERPVHLVLRLLREHANEEGRTSVGDDFRAGLIATLNACRIRQHR